MESNNEPTREERTIISLYHLMVELNPRISQFRPYMAAISHAEDLERKYLLHVPQQQGEE